ncbi:hypothetical protein BJY01DRAFT_244655 [Aspergillus pseudoustus]|uniref:Uncharacterized protein n=1 Tax=Aspergillus pseudoustus TaxID=1810923 RepID=A0ABR4KID0_9EURO
MSGIEQPTVCSVCGLEVCNNRRWITFSYDFSDSVDLQWFAAEFDKVASNNVCRVKKYVISRDHEGPQTTMHAIVDMAAPPEHGNPGVHFRVPDGLAEFSDDHFPSNNDTPTMQAEIIPSAGWLPTCIDAVNAMRSEARLMCAQGLSIIGKVLELPMPMSAATRAAARAAANDASANGNADGAANSTDYNAGHAAGYGAGYSDSHADIGPARDAYRASYRASYRAGYGAGYDAGYGTAYGAGFSAGYSAGYMAGLDPDRGSGPHAGPGAGPGPGPGRGAGHGAPLGR